MNQEKKVIRVLKPTKKAKKTSPFYFGVIGTAFGVIATSVLLFTFLKDDSSSTSAQSVQNQNIENMIERTPTQTSNDGTTHNQSNHSNNESEHDDIEHDGYNQPQPNVNEITNVFKHKTDTPTTAVIEQQPNSTGNPFDNFGQPKPQPTPVVTHTTKPTVTQKPLQTKVNEPPKTIKKPDVVIKKPEAKTEQLTAKKEPKAVEKDEDYEVPHATVQIAVTRKAKE